MYISKPLAKISSSFSNINGECVTANNKEHFFEFKISGRSLFCHSVESDNSGSSKIIINLESVESKYKRENKETICFSPDDKVLNASSSFS